MRPMSLTTKWIFHMPNASRLQTVPIVSGGVMYVTQPNEIYALDALVGARSGSTVAYLR